MEHKREREIDMEWKRKMDRMLRLLTVFPDHVSEFLYAAILVGEKYPELADTFEQMAIAEAARFRLLGGILLRNGMDPAVRGLLRRNGRASRGLTAETDDAIEAFIREMSKRTEAQLKESRHLLTMPDIEAEDDSNAIIEGQEMQLYRLNRMLS